MRVYVGITGLAGAGKDTVAALLEREAELMGIRAIQYKLSDEIREELMLRGMNPHTKSRALLIRVGNALRAEFGGGVLAERVVSRESRRPAPDPEPASLVTVSGIRNPGEVAAFRAAWKGRFLLVSVLAGDPDRAARAADRGQYSEDRGHRGSAEQADQAIGIRDCIGLADWAIHNDGTLADLRSQVRDLLNNGIRPIFQPQGPSSPPRSQQGRGG